MISSLKPPLRRFSALTAPQLIPVSACGGGRHKRSFERLRPEDNAALRQPALGRGADAQGRGAGRGGLIPAGRGAGGATAAGRPVPVIAAAAATGPAAVTMKPAAVAAVLTAADLDKARRPLRQAPAATVDAPAKTLKAASATAPVADDPWCATAPPQLDSTPRSALRACGHIRTSYRFHSRDFLAPGAHACTSYEIFVAAQHPLFSRHRSRMFQRATTVAAEEDLSDVDDAAPSPEWAAAAAEAVAAAAAEDEERRPRERQRKPRKERDWDRDKKGSDTVGGASAALAGGNRAAATSLEALAQRSAADDSVGCGGGGGAGVGPVDPAVAVLMDALGEEFDRERSAHLSLLVRSTSRSNKGALGRCCLEWASQRDLFVFSAGANGSLEGR